MSPMQTKVLVVDDEPAIRCALHTTLSSLGFYVEEASGAEQAIAVVRRERFDAALLDINMPGLGASKRVAPFVHCLLGFPF